ncbi:MAG: protein kinase [Pirellulaceae bacterium]
MSAESAEEHIERLLDRWEASRDAGESLSAEQLADGNVEVAQVLQQRIDELESFDRFTRSPAPSDASQTVRIGQYRLIEPIARGATSVVYRAVLSEVSGENVSDSSNQSDGSRHSSVEDATANPPPEIFAIKVLNPDRMDGPGAARFRREVSILRRLDHPQIARILDSGIGRLGLHDQPYLVMPLIEGEPLDRYVFAKNLPVPERVALLISVARAVQAAHEKGVIHRDLKPANILVTADGVPMIVDFGLAKRSKNADDVDSFQTTAAFIGTLPFMSPEQTSGSRDEVDQRCDVYSLGVIAYQLLAGELPIQTQDCSILDAHLRIRNLVPKSLSSINREIPSALARVISTALAKEPIDRYTDMASFIDDLQRCQDGRPVLAKAPSPLDNALRWVKRHPWLTASVLTVAASLLAATAISLNYATEARAAQKQTQAALDRETEQKNAAIEHENRFRKLHYQVIQGLVDSKPLLASEQLDDDQLFAESDRLVPWHVLRNRCNHLQRSWPADEVAFAEDGQFFLRRVGSDYTTHDMNSGNEIARFEIGDDDVRLVAISSNAKWLALGDLDNHVDIRDGLTGNRITYLQSHGANSHPAASFSRDNSRLATTGGDRHVRIWDTNEWKLVAERRLQMKGHPGSIRWFPDGSKLILATTNGRAFVFDAQLQHQIRMETVTDYTMSVASHEGTLLAHVNEVAIGEFNTETGERTRLIFRDHRMSYVFNLSPSGKHLVIASGFAVSVKDLKTSVTLLDVPSPDQLPRAAAMSDSEQQIYCHTKDRRLHQYSYATPSDLETLVAADKAAEGSTISANGQSAARWNRPNRLELFCNGHRQHSIEFADDAPPVFALSFDGQQLAVGRTNNVLEVHDTKLAQKIAELSSPHPITEIIAIDHGWLVKCDNCLVYRFRIGVSELFQLTSDILDTNLLLATSANGKIFATASRRQPPRVYSALGRQQSSSIEIATSTIRQSGLALSEDGSLLAVGKAFGEIELYESTSGKALAVCRGLHLGAMRMAFSLDKRLLASAHRDRTLAIWDVASGLEQCRTFLPSPATALAFSADSTQLFVSLENGSVVRLGRRSNLSSAGSP